DALEIPGPEVLQLEQIAKKPACALGNDDHVRLGKPLQARREVRRFTDDAALLRVARSDQVTDDDQPRRNADPGLQRSASLEPGHCCDQLQSRPYCSFGVILVRLRIAEVHEDTVA